MREIVFFLLRILLVLAMLARFTNVKVKFTVRLLVMELLSDLIVCNISSRTVEVRSDRYENVNLNVINIITVKRSSVTAEHKAVY